ncbi:MAG: hypothetical protein HZA17_09635 [Nitrospirae bacterium]|nr:hypothetical protein [Nitrospirota bacterium]
MKKIIFALFLVLITYTVSAAYGTRHYYVTGRVDAVNSAGITIDGARFHLAAHERVKMPAAERSAGARSDEVEPVFKVIIQTRKGGVYQETAGKFVDLHPGDYVNAKLDGNVIIEITVERWKR